MCGVDGGVWWWLALSRIGASPTVLLENMRIWKMRKRWFCWCGCGGGGLDNKVDPGLDGVPEHRQFNKSCWLPCRQMSGARGVKRDNYRVEQSWWGS